MDNTPAFLVEKNAAPSVSKLCTGCKKHTTHLARVVSKKKPRVASRVVWECVRCNSH